ncbi:MAG: glycosyltransferase [Phycisphaerae bacterium]|nr:glycosyltransferase [Phycisphaerae bacterium]
MNIIITSNERLPALLYGGSPRVVWCLAKELSLLGHRVQLLAPLGSECPFADVLPYEPRQDVRELIPPDVDIVHFNSGVPKAMQSPYIFTQHGNVLPGESIDRNTVFVSKNHAARHGSESFVHNGLDWQDAAQSSLPRCDFHFLGKAAWRKKNVRGAIAATKEVPSARLHVLGGHRLNFSMGFRFTASSRISFHGMTNDHQKYEIMSRSQGLVFPVRWHEPFGLAIIESMHCGCPVFGTPYGSLPELVPPEVGLLSSSQSELAAAMADADRWDPATCTAYATEYFNSKRMALAYLEKYERVINGESLNATPPTLLKPEEKLLPWYP